MKISFSLLFFGLMTEEVCGLIEFFLFFFEYLKKKYDKNVEP